MLKVKKPGNYAPAEETHVWGVVEIGFFTRVEIGFGRGHEYRCYRCPTLFPSSSAAGATSRRTEHKGYDL